MPKAHRPVAESNFTVNPERNEFSFCTTCPQKLDPVSRAQRCRRCLDCRSKRPGRPKGVAPRPPNPSRYRQSAKPSSGESFWVGKSREQLSDLVKKMFTPQTSESDFNQ